MRSRPLLFNMLSVKTDYIAHTAHNRGLNENWSYNVAANVGLIHNLQTLKLKPIEIIDAYY